MKKYDFTWWNFPSKIELACFILQCIQNFREKYLNWSKLQKMPKSIYKNCIQKMNIKSFLYPKNPSLKTWNPRKSPQKKSLQTTANWPPIVWSPSGTDGQLKKEEGKAIIALPPGALRSGTCWAIAKRTRGNLCKFREFFIALC